MFNYQNHNVRTVLINGEPWFVAKDVCNILEISNSRMAIDRLNKTMKGVSSIDTLGGKQEMSVINESGIYKLVFTSRKPEAEKFTDWLADEVIPTIRKHGAYMTPEVIEETLTDPDFIIQLATRLKEEQQARLKAEEQIELDRPKVIFAEALEVSENTILIGELAKLLKQNGVEIGQNRLFQKLREEGYLGRKGEYHNLPTQKAMELGLFKIKTRTINNPDGSIRTTRTTKVTGKGQIYFINKFKKEMAIA